MESSQIVMEEKLGFFGLLKESLSILFKNPNFIIFTFLISFPLFCSLTIYEIIFQQTLIETRRIVQEIISSSNNPYDIFNDDYASQMNFERWIGKFSGKFFLLGLLYLMIIYFLDLFNTIALVDMASIIYKGEKPMNLKGMFSRSINETRLKGPLITSIYVLLLASLVSFGLLSLAPYIYIAYEVSFSNFLGIPFLVLFIALLTKYIEWNAIWNMGIVISVLEEKQGDVAIVISAYLSRGSRLRGFLLMLVFFAWRLALRLSSLYAGWVTGGGGVMSTAVLVHIGLVCLANVLRWVIFVVYFYDCKTNRSKEKMGLEEGTAAEQPL